MMMQQEKEHTTHSGGSVNVTAAVISWLAMIVAICLGVGMQKEGKRTTGRKMA